MLSSIFVNDTNEEHRPVHEYENACWTVFLENTVVESSFSS